MKKLFFLLFVITMGFSISSCSQKLPVPTSEKTGILAIPVTCLNYTQYQYGYYYNLVYSPETQIPIQIVPLGSRKFAIINGFPPGKYEINGINSISSVTRGIPDVGAETTELSRSIPIEIRSNEITLLNYLFSVEQRLQNDNDPERYYQGFSLKALDESQYNQTVLDLQSLQNADLWNLAQVSAAPTTDQDNGVISSNQSYLSWRSWRRD